METNDLFICLCDVQELTIMWLISCDNVLVAAKRIKGYT